LKVSSLRDLREEVVASRKSILTALLSDGSLDLPRAVEACIEARDTLQRVVRQANRNPDPTRVLKAYQTRVAGEVRHVRDNRGDSSQWAYSLNNPLERELAALSDYTYDAKQVKYLAKCLRATNSSLGHAMSAYTLFAKMKSRSISPDGMLGGKGYIQKVSDMRRQFMNVVEALSALSDTLHDEVHAPYWAPATRQDRETKNLVEHADEIKENPESWAEEEAEQDQKERTGG
jgi:hypothetical protein